MCVICTTMVIFILAERLYWVPQLIEIMRKIIKKNLYLLDLKIWGLKRCSFDLVYFKY
jgi:hypothetical protein